MYLSEKFLSISPSPTLSIDAKFKQMKKDGLDVVGFGAGEPDFDTPKHIKDAAIKAILDGKTKYTPASGMPELKKAVCQKFMRDNSLYYEPNQIVVSNGAKHSLVNVFGAILNEGDEVIIPAPYWVSYPEIVKINSGVPVTVYASEDNDFKVTPEQIEEKITEKTRAIVLNSPSNPTGMVYTKEELEKIAEIALKHSLYIVSDEIYEHLIYEGKHFSIAQISDEVKDITIIVNGVSKTYAMTGWRIGYTASNPTIAKVMSNVQSHATSNPNTIAQIAAIEALACGVPLIVADNRGTREYLQNDKNGLICEAFDQDAFVTAIDKVYSNVEYRKKLADYCRESVIQFSTEETVRTMERIYSTMDKRIS